MIGSPSTLLDIVDERWRQDAACRDADPWIFNALTFADEQDALDCCRHCPVVPECLDWARRERDYTGVAGGKIWGRVRRRKATGA